MKTEKQVTIILDYPVQLADRVLDEITLRRPTMKERVEFDGKKLEDVREEMKMFGRLTGLRYEEMLLLDMGDYDKIAKEFLRFRSPDTPEGNPDAGVDAG
ncbi:phage tail assembly protein [Desulfosarcina sp. OttesenSCG-928-A07]|nr:phage tail assembly protein [Desulfosarcina sp. OttesenSCG-928-G17]MDL2329090.1 phage tail assembly protein [Desulfosarcina sp. OttesenSCG-928-A07]